MGSVPRVFEKFKTQKIVFHEMSTIYSFIRIYAYIL